jgi:hypothetical protein
MKMCSRWVFAVGLVMPTLCGSLGQRETAEQAGEQAGFGRRQTEGGSQGVGTILRVRRCTDEHGGNGCGL